MHGGFQPSRALLRTKNAKRSWGSKEGTSFFFPSSSSSSSYFANDKNILYRKIYFFNHIFKLSRNLYFFFCFSSKIFFLLLFSFFALLRIFNGFKKFYTKTVVQRRREKIVLFAYTYRDPYFFALSFFFSNIQFRFSLQKKMYEDE